MGYYFTLKVILTYIHFLSHNLFTELGGPSRGSPHRLWFESLVVLCNTIHFGIDLKPSKYRATIANTNTNRDTFNL